VRITAQQQNKHNTISSRGVPHGGFSYRGGSEGHEVVGRIAGSALLPVIPWRRLVGGKGADYHLPKG